MRFRHRLHKLRTRSGKGSGRVRVLLTAALAALLGSDAGAVTTDIEVGQDSEQERGQGHTTTEYAAPDLRLADELPAALEWMSELERTETIVTWAASGSPAARRVIARALREAPPAVGLHTVIEELASDPDPGVRLAIADGARLRREEAPRRMTAVLLLLAEDVHPTVRMRAREALERAPS